MNDWFLFFDNMLPGQAIEINTTGKRDPELFKQMCMLYIDEGHNDFEFSNDYKYFKRIEDLF